MSQGTHMTSDTARYMKRHEHSMQNNMPWAHLIFHNSLCVSDIMEDKGDRAQQVKYIL